MPVWQRQATGLSTSTLVSLAPLAEDMEAFAIQVEKYKQASALSLVRQTVLTLIDERGGRDGGKATGLAMDQEEYLHDDGSVYRVMFRWAMRLELAYFFEDFEVGEEMCDKFRTRPTDIEGTMFRVPSCSMYVAMELWARKNRGRRFRKLARMYVRDVKRWVDKQALNVQHKLLLLQAQRLSLKRGHKEQEVAFLFNQAIISSKKSGFTHDAALAHELAGKYFLTLRDHEAAAQHLTDARQLYGAWRAHAKVNHLLERYAFLSTDDDDCNSLNYSSHRGKARFSEESTAKHIRFDPFRFGWMSRRTSVQVSLMKRG